MHAQGPLLHLDCASGAGGDMLAAALLAVSAGGDDPVAGALATHDRVVAPALKAVGIDPAVVHVAATRRGGLAALAFTVDERPGFATFAELVAAVHRAPLDPAVVDGVAAVAERMAAAERAVHGDGEEHLHELAGLDTAVDLVAVVALVAALSPAQVSASPPALGSGTVRSAHGELAVPAPAVVWLLRRAGAGTGPGAELTTPTGAALLAHLTGRFGGVPAGRLLAAGVGAGGRELGGRPNVLRALLVEPLDRAPGGPGAPWSQDEVELLEATIDDLSAELLAEAAQRLLDAGALDVWSTPATMKKSRAGAVLHVLARPAQRAALAAVAFRETSTFGLRVLPARRLLLDERRATVTVAGEDVGVRLGFLDGRLVTASPEYEDCRRAAARAGRPAKDVYDEARTAARLLPEAAGEGSVAAGDTPGGPV
jgi:hypothetical protein